MLKITFSKKIGFTLVETMISVLIFSIIIVGGFQAYNSVLVGKIKLIESTDIQKEAFYFSEKFFEEIKKGGTIDYEEYFARTVVNGNDTGAAIYSSGHYLKPTGFGNYSDDAATGYGTLRFVLCRSDKDSNMGSNGCIQNFNNLGINVSEKKMRYGQYALQFIDYNSNADEDKIQPANVVVLLGDEDGDGGITGDDDDEYLGLGPVAFSGSKVEEIYLISADNTIRTLFRWNVKQDPDQPGVKNCSPDYSDNTFSGGCLGTIEFLKLKGLDIGMDHDNRGVGLWHEGIIDTWVIDGNMDPNHPRSANPASHAQLGYTIATTSADSYRQPLFSDDINVSDVKFHLYPNKDLNLAWRDASPEVNVAPYIRIQMTLSPSFKAQRGIKGEIPKIKINTTISLTDIYSR